MSTTISGGACNHVHIDLIVTEPEEDISIKNNRSLVVCKLVGWLDDPDPEYWYDYNYNGIAILLDQKRVFYLANNNPFSIRIKGSHTQSNPLNIAAGSIYVDHEADGSKTSNVIFFLANPNNSQYTWYKSADISLTNIDRASQPTVSADSVNLGSAVTITTNRTSSELTHTIKYKFGSSTGTIGTGVTNTVSWTPPASLANQIPNATSGSCVITCKTYSGETLIGSKSVNLTLTIPDTAAYNPNPSLSISADTWIAYVQNLSKATITVTPGLKYGASIASLKITANGTSYTLDADHLTVTTDLLTTAGSNTITAVLKDSRGRKTTITETITVYEYFSPKITRLSVSRYDASGNADDAGAFMKIKYGASVAPIYDGDGNPQNETLLTFEYKETTDTTWTLYATKDGEFTYSGTTRNIAVDVNKTYDVRLTVSDSYKETKKTASLSTAFTLLDFNDSGKGMAIGKVSEKADALEVGMDTYIGGKLYIGDETNAIGNLISGTIYSSTTLASGTAKSVAEINLLPGTYLFTFAVRFPETSTTKGKGERRVGVASTKDASTADAIAGSADGSYTKVAAAKIVNATNDSGTKYYVNAYQTSGASMTIPTAGVDLRIVKVG